MEFGMHAANGTRTEKDHAQFEQGSLRDGIPSLLPMRPAAGFQRVQPKLFQGAQGQGFAPDNQK